MIDVIQIQLQPIAIVFLMLVALTGCAASDAEETMADFYPTIETARAAPDTTVRLFYDLFIQQQYAATETLLVPETVASITGNGRNPYAEVQRRQDQVLGGISSYVIHGVRYLGPDKAEVDADYYTGEIRFRETITLVKNPGGWQISGSVPHGIGQ